MRLIDEATGIVYRTLEQGEVLTYRGRFEDCFEAKHNLIKTGERTDQWRLDIGSKGVAPEGIKPIIGEVRGHLPNSFRDIMEKHVENLKNSRYAGIECLIANFILSTGLRIEALELVETTKNNEISWSVRKKT